MSGKFASGVTWLSEHRPTALGVSTAASVGVGALAFSLSFTALTELAHQNGIPNGQAWMLPLVVDGLVVVSTAATAKLKGWRSIYPWILLIVGTAISVWGNVMHAKLNGFGAVGMAIAAIPPLVLLAVSHLTILLARQAEREAAEVADAVAEESAVEGPVVEQLTIEQPIVEKVKKAKKAKKAKKVATEEPATEEPATKTIYVTPTNAPVLVPAPKEALHPVG